MDARSSEGIAIGGGVKEDGELRKGGREVESSRIGRFGKRNFEKG